MLTLILENIGYLTILGVHDIVFAYDFFELRFEV